MRIFFVLDVCDREVIAWSAVAQAGWLPDNYCSAYLANDTADTARAVGLTLLFTPVRSPEWTTLTSHPASAACASAQ